MMRSLLAAVNLFSVATGLTDVPKGMCFDCEVSCIKDCSAKFESEVMKDDMQSLLQASKKVNMSALKVPNPNQAQLFKASKQLAKEYSNKFFTQSKHSCDAKKGCGIANQCVTSIENELANMDKQSLQDRDEHELDRGKDVIEGRGHKAWTDVSAEDVTIADLPKVHLDTTPRLHSDRAVSKEQMDTLDNAHMKGGHLRFLGMASSLAPVNKAPNPWPLHPVKLGVFSKGGQTLTQCLTYCFAATCGCSGQGIVSDASMPKMTKEAGKAGFYTDTKPAWKYSPATKEQCGAGVKKIIKGLFIDYYPGVGGVVEVCSAEYFKNKAGASGALGLTDPMEDAKKCDCGVNRLDCHEPDFGCSWNELGYCEFKAAAHTRCFHRYHMDKTL